MFAYTAVRLSRAPAWAEVVRVDDFAAQVLCCDPAVFAAFTDPDGLRANHEASYAAFGLAPPEDLTGHERFSVNDLWYLTV